MSDYVEKYKCGSCSYYEYEGKNSKGYCGYYKAYYFPDDSCNHWEQSSSVSSSSSGCFITTACCEYKGLADDCELMQTLRHFRDTYIKEQEYGIELLQQYYGDAPAIIEAIDRSGKQEEIYDEVYRKLEHIVSLIDRNLYDKAVIEYMMMVYRLAKI